MNFYRNLPAVVLPNIENQNDSTALLFSGKKLPLSELLLSISSVQNLRFMIQELNPRTPANPRITWQVQKDKNVVLVAAFAIETDSHDRVVSSAVIYNLSDEQAFQYSLLGLPTACIDALKDYFNHELPNIKQWIQSQIYFGNVGGEYDTKKKSYAYEGSGNNEYSWSKLIFAILLITLIAIFVFYFSYKSN